jgi:uncharacterized membrane protein
MIRRRSTPWIHRWSRIIIAAIAALGAITTGYLTYEKLTGSKVACTAGCDVVLNSPWGTVFGQPLALFGFLAYAGMLAFALLPLFVKSEQNKEQHKKAENTTWLLLLVGSIAMTIFSGYLMYVLATQLQVVCPYCIASASFSLSMLVLTLLGRNWEDVGQVLFTAFIVGIVTLVGTLGVYSGVGNQASNPSPNVSPNSPNVDNVALTIKPSGEIIFDQYKAPKPDPLKGWEVTTSSGEAEIALANHVVKSGAKEYTAFWCHHCHEQKLIFGKEAAEIISENNVKVECAPQSPKAKLEDCQAAKVEGFPTWVINGKQYSGVQNLDELAKVTGYTGANNFKYFKAKAKA